MRALTPRAVQDAVAALASGWLYDRIGLRVLVALPVLAAAVPWLGFSNNTALAVTGVLIWGAAMGIQESTMRAVAAELAPKTRPGSADGPFTACYGVAWLAGSVPIGILYPDHHPSDRSGHIHHGPASPDSLILSCPQ